MNWKYWVAALVVVAAAYAAWRVWMLSEAINLPSSDEDIAAVQAISAAQNEDAFYRPVKQSLETQPKNPLNNVYFGDLHIHTSISSDAYLFGNRLDMDTAYRFAKGESGARLRTGEYAELSRPLDFAALTDHAEGFGRRLACENPDASEAALESCASLETPSLLGFMQLRRVAQARPRVRPLTVFNDDPALERTYAARTWQQVREAADRHYEPGKFTTFAAYEYSPAMPDRGKNHRNVFFRSSDVPQFAVSSFDAESEIELWQQLEATCVGECQFMTIPHNLNKTWGLAFAGRTIDGVAYTEEAWRLRERNEPLVEMFQIKGSSECSVGFGAGDEECGFEQFWPVCAEGQETSCIYPTSMARDGLRIGLELEDELGVNPLEFGMIGSTDTHNSNPGDAEEWDYRGATSFASSPARRRMSPDNLTGIRVNNPGGLAAVWAPENTREALFDAMQRKEVYATSGTRIILRMFAGTELPADIADSVDLEAAYRYGAPMGGRLHPRIEHDANLSIFVWATQDPNNAPLARIQIVKGWVEDGESHEAVYDVACGGSELDPATGKCLPNGATVSLSDCSWDVAAGAPELKALWTDPDFDPRDDAFYYARVVQNPTCRWTTYDSLRLGREPPGDSPPTVTEMAWGSPVWVKAPMAASAPARQPELLSAFFGLDNALPFIANGLCLGASGKDGMPVVLSETIDPETLQADDFRVITRSGVSSTPHCVTLRPAQDVGELRTVLLIGEFGNADADPPAQVQVVGDLESDGAANKRLNFNGTEVDVTPLADGPSLVWAEVVARDIWTQDGRGTRCPANSAQVIRVTWAGGVRLQNGKEPGEAERKLYQVSVTNQDGSTETVIPAALADLGDNDNNHYLCLDTTARASSVAFPGGHLVDPNRDLNPDSLVEIR